MSFFPTYILKNTYNFIFSTHKLHLIVRIFILQTLFYGQHRRCLTSPTRVGLLMVSLAD